MNILDKRWLNKHPMAGGWVTRLGEVPHYEEIVLHRFKVDDGERETSFYVPTNYATDTDGYEVTPGQTFFDTAEEAYTHALTQTAREISNEQAKLRALLDGRQALDDEEGSR